MGSRKQKCMAVNLNETLDYQGFQLQKTNPKLLLGRCGCPSRGSIEGQVVWGSEQPYLGEGAPAHIRRVELNDLEDLFPSMILWYLHRSTLLVARRSSLHLNNVSCMDCFAVGQDYKHLQGNFQQGYSRNKFARAEKMSLSSRDQYLQVKVFKFSLWNCLPWLQVCHF